jgi:hypothetical protein
MSSGAKRSTAEPWYVSLGTGLEAGVAFTIARRSCGTLLYNAFGGVRFAAMLLSPLPFGAR